MKGGFSSTIAFKSLLRSFGLLAVLGAITEAFSQEIITPLPGVIDAIAVQPNKQFLVSYRNGVARANQDGTIDQTFSRSGFGSILAIKNDLTFVTGGIPDPFVLQPDGKTVIWDLPNLYRK